MTRLIDAEALVYDFGEIDNGAQKRFDLFVTNEVIAEQPTVDAVPVIRCKDCKHNVANKKIDPLDITDYSGEDIICDYFMTDGLNSEDYCSYAERKEE